MNARPIRYTIDSAWDAWHASQEVTAREWLVVHYASLVKFVAGRLAAGLPKTVDTGDLVSAGVFGLMNAIDKFDPSQGFKFETYAVPRIRGAILDGLRALDWVPRSVRSRSRSVQDAIAQLEHELGRTPTDEEIASELQISVEELEKWLTDIAAGAVGPLDHVAMDNAPAEADAHLQPGRAMEEGELRDAMRTEISRLPEREQAILILYYEDGLTLSEIGDALGVTESRVSQIHTKAVLQLRSRLAAAGMA
ncbi:MAG: FliA/WhiG family RNA polymerase sigma factor [Acidimicrobiaceae bacterium]|jgi:RNA polymerase sigma factor for flagellar operon FliA|nr:FliA/WhiG family RNA polymerase sigma factor [Ilumatobacteraceae bacterium]